MGLLNPPAIRGENLLNLVAFTKGLNSQVHLRSPWFSTQRKHLMEADPDCTRRAGRPAITGNRENPARAAAISLPYGITGQILGAQQQLEGV